jgi:hypothetical protein
VGENGCPLTVTSSIEFGHPAGDVVPPVPPFPRVRLPAPPAPGAAPGQTVNPPVAEQPQRDGRGYTKYDVADHALSVRDCELDGQPVRQGKDVPPVMVRRGSAARTSRPLPPVGGVNASCLPAAWIELLDVFAGLTRFTDDPVSVFLDDQILNLRRVVQG